MFLFGGLLIVIALFIILHYWITMNYKYWRNLGVPFAKPNFIFGNIKDFIFRKSHFALVMNNIYKIYNNERYVGYYELGTPALMLIDPELIGQILTKDFSIFHDRMVTTNEETDPLSAHLINLTGSRWKKVRSKLVTLFSSGTLKLMYGIVDECVHELDQHLTSYIDTSKPADLKEIMSKFTTDVIGKCAFGLDFNSLKDDNSIYRIMGRKLFRISHITFFKALLRWVHPKLIQWIKIRNINEEVNKFFFNLVKETIEYRGKVHCIKKNDFVQLMIDALKLEQINGPVEATKEDIFTKNLIAANMFLFYAAGFETTASTLTYCLYELALNPNVQNQLQNEISTTLDANNGSLNYELLDKLTYMDMVLSETLRKHHPVPSISRLSTQPYKIPGTRITLPPKIKVHIPIYALHHDPKYYPEPEKFIPERFSKENLSSRPCNTFLPFGDGPRKCIGFRFAKLMMKMCLASIISKYRFSICNQKTIVPYQVQPRELLFALKHEMWLTVSRNETEYQSFTN